jgi:hypothetical protein
MRGFGVAGDCLESPTAKRLYYEKGLYSLESRVNYSSDLSLTDYLMCYGAKCREAGGLSVQDWAIVRTRAVGVCGREFL